MSKAIAISGSPRMEKGLTDVVLAHFLDGMREFGCETEVAYASRLHVKPCVCGDMLCWYKTPGKCFIRDEMDVLLSKLERADVLVLATPVYVPLPGEFQNILNRLCPLMTPRLEFRSGRTRARMRDDVMISKIVLVSTGGWWERGNFETVVRIAQELAADAGVEFAGAVLRPHAALMQPEGKLTEDGISVLEAAKRAGRELVKEGAMRKETLEEVSRPLISEEALRDYLNRLL